MQHVTYLQRLARGLVLLGLFSPTGLLATEPQQVAFSTSDGFWVHADYYGPTSQYIPGPMVILLHPEGSDRQFWKPLVDPLQEAGFVILALDMRGHGGSRTSDTSAQLERRDPRLFESIQHDLRGAYDWLAAQEHVDRARFALVGAGAGAGVALQYAAKDRSADAIVCLSPTETAPGLDPSGDLGQIHGRPILLVATENEKDECRRFTKRSAGVQTYYYEPPDEHSRAGDVLATVPSVKKPIVDFLIRAVGRPTKTTVYGSIRSSVFHKPGSGWIDEIQPGNLRHYSSPAEAKQRGLRPSKSKGPRGSRPRGPRGASPSADGP